MWIKGRHVINVFSHFNSGHTDLAMDYYIEKKKTNGLYTGLKDIGNIITKILNVSFTHAFSKYYIILFNIVYSSNFACNNSETF